MDKFRRKYQVFISSTYRDLRAEREAVIWEMLKAEHIPVGMEAFPATDDRGWKIIERTISHSDYYILLVGGRYGTVDGEVGLSWTEREYDYAHSLGVPILAFARSQNHITMDCADSKEDMREKLRDFLTKVEDRHHRREWSSLEDLCLKVNAAISQQIRGDEDSGAPRPGWYRGIQIDARENRIVARRGELGSEGSLAGENLKKNALDVIVLLDQLQRKVDEGSQNDEEGSLLQEKIDAANKGLRESSIRFNYLTLDGHSRIDVARNRANEMYGIFADLFSSGAGSMDDIHTAFVNFSKALEKAQEEGE